MAGKLEAFGELVKPENRNAELRGIKPLRRSRPYVEYATRHDSRNPNTEGRIPIVLLDVLSQGLSCGRTTQVKVARGNATPQYSFYPKNRYERHRRKMRKSSTK